MAIDWTVPQPSYEELHAKLDALQTERNAAAAEAQLWQRRALNMQKQLDQVRAELRAANASHAQWEVSYDDLLQQLRRLEVKLCHTRFDYEAAESVVGFLTEGIKAAARLRNAA